MAEDPVFSAFNTGDSASTFADVISRIKSDMEAIERSAKNIEQSLAKASKFSMGSGGGSSFGAQNAGGNTGFSKSQGMNLGRISPLPGAARAAVFGVGAAVGGWAGGIAAAGFPDLRTTPQEALDLEAARFGVRQATGSFSSFKNIMDSAQTSFNVQDQFAFAQTLVAGTQRMGLVGMMGGGTVGERMAGQAIGGVSSMAGLAGIDQSQVPGMMASMWGAPAYYAAMATGVQTRNPVTGAPASIESLVNQTWNNNGWGNKSGEEILTQIDRSYGIGSMGYASLMQTYGDPNVVNAIVEGMRVRAQNKGQALKEGQLEEQANEAGILGTENTQGMEGLRGLEGSKLKQTESYTNVVTEGVAEAAGLIKEAVDLLTELDGPLRAVVDFMTKYAAELDVFQTKLPGMTDSLTKFFSGLPAFLTSLLAGGIGGGLGSLLGGGGLGSLLGKGALSLLTGPLALPLGVGAAVAGVGLAGKWAVSHFTDYDEHTGTTANAATAANAGTNQGTYVAPTSGYGGHSEGKWFVEADQDAKIHQGEMILPNRIATAVREELAVGQDPSPISNLTAPKRSGSREGTVVNIYLSVQRATDQEAIQFAGRVKRIIDDERELMAIGMGSL